MLEVNNFFREVAKKDLVMSGSDWLLLTHLLCSTYGWTYQELVSQPIPFVFGLLEGLKLQREAEEKAYKSSKKK